MADFSTVWRHREGAPLQTAKEALATAQAGSWSLLDPPTQARYMRSFVITCLSAASFYSDRPLGVLDSSLYGDPERNAAGATIARTIQLMIPPKTRVVILGSFETTEGGPPTPPGSSGDVGEPISIATVVIVTAVAAAAVFIAHEVAQVINSTTFEEEKTKRMVNETAKANEVLAQHVEREKVVGKALPFDEQERNMLQSLQELQHQIAAERNQPLPSPFAGAQDFVTNTVGSLGGALWPIAVGVLGFALLSK